jgi:hypothetical protein
MRWFTGRAADPLEGRWVIDPSDTAAVAEFGQVELTFERGRLTYEIILDEKKQVMLLTYRIAGEFLVTDQPSHPRSERTRFRLEGDTLALAFGGVEGRFLRA